MSSRQAIKMLINVGFVVKKRGKGDHVLMVKGSNLIIIPDGKSSLSYGMVGRIRAFLKK